MTDAHIHADADGVILFDAERAPQVSHAWFDPAHWQALGRLRGRGGGRGSVCFVDTAIGPCVLRHYHRGGMVAKLLGDRYLWSGRERTRSFAEFRFTALLAERGLPVPEPVAARYRRRGMHYTADLITRRIGDAVTLAEHVQAGRLGAPLLERVGGTIARFHLDGVWHADLNAHNILCTPSREYLIDFDRGELRKPALEWRRDNLHRLRRSLLKVGAGQAGDEAFEAEVWAPLMRGYERQFEA